MPLIQAIEQLSGTFSLSIQMDLPSGANRQSVTLADHNTAEAAIADIALQIGACPIWQNGTLVRLTRCGPELTTTPLQPARMDEMVVTTARREEPVLNIPLSVSVLGSGISRAPFDAIEDISPRVANVTTLFQGRRSQYTVGIRGVSQVGGFTRASSIIIGDLNLNQNITIPYVPDLDRVEIIRGSHGQIYGRNTVGGLIRLQLRTPTDQLEGYAKIGAERFGTFFAETGVSIPVDQDLAVRLSGYWRHSDGPLENLVPNGSTSAEDAFSLRMLADWDITENLSAELMVQHSQEDEGLEQGIPAGIIDSVTQVRLDATTVPFPDDPIFPETVSQVARDARESSKGKTTLAHLKLRTRLFAIDVESVTGLVDQKVTTFSDLDKTSLDANARYGQTSYQSISQELKGNTILWNTLELSFGGHLILEDSDALDSIDFGPDFHRLGAFPEVPPVLDIPLRNLLNTVVSERDNESYALFGEARWAITERLSLTAGLRYQWERNRFSGLNFSANFPLGSASFDEKFEAALPRVALAMQWAENFMTYATVSKGYKPGGSYDSPAPEFFSSRIQNEVAWTYEVGAKARLGRTGYVTANLFYLDWSNIQVATVFPFVLDSGVTLFLLPITNNGDARSKGFEVEFAYDPLDWLSLRGGVGYLDAKFKNLSGAQVNFQSTDLTGRRLPLAPKWSIFLSAQTSWQVGNGWLAGLAVEWSYNSAMFARLDDFAEISTRSRIPAQHLVNLRLSLVRENWQLDLYADNLFDRDRYIGTTGAGTLTGAHLLPDRRRWGIALTYSF